MSEPRLSFTLEHPRHPQVCQSCGMQPEDLALLGRWREHDDADRPERIVVVLCRDCSERIIEPHPRLYARLTPTDPFPGCMAICVDCKHRSGVTCLHPDARGNGGPGVELTIERPVRAHVSRVPRRLSGFMTLWPSAAKACKQKEVAS